MIFSVSLMRAMAKRGTKFRFVKNQYDMVSTFSPVVGDITLFLRLLSVWDTLQYSQQPMCEVWLAEFCPPITECFFWTYFSIAALHLMVKDSHVLKPENI